MKIEIARIRVRAGGRSIEASLRLGRFESLAEAVATFGERQALHFLNAAYLVSQRGIKRDQILRQEIRARRERT